MFNITNFQVNGDQNYDSTAVEIPTASGFLSYLPTWEWPLILFICKVCVGPLFQLQDSVTLSCSSRGL